jgi:hypothetical protein
MVAQNENTVLDRPRKKNDALVENSVLYSVRPFSGEVPP